MTIYEVLAERKSEQAIEIYGYLLASEAALETLVETNQATDEDSKKLSCVKTLLYLLHKKGPTLDDYELFADLFEVI